MNFSPLPTILYGDYNILEANYSKERIDEARDYICYAITKAKERGRKICLGCSCGKDSTILLQLTIEAARKMDYSFDNIVIAHQRTTYETTSGTEFTNRYIQKCEENGYHVDVQITPLHARYAVRTLGVGTGSHAGRQRVCTEQKTSIVKERKETREMINLSGTRAEESPKRASEERETKSKDAAWSWIFRPLKYLTEADVWGYLRELGTTDFGVTYEFVKEYYDSNRINRDGCWTCYAGPCKRDTLARMECRTRLQFLRANMRIAKDDFLHYRFQTLPPDSVAGPKNITNRFYEMWLNRPKFCALSYRPVEFCMAAYEVVKDIERRRNEILVPEEEKVFIDDIHRFRYVYRLNRVKRWMMNPACWHGYNLMDGFCETTKNAVSPYIEKSIVLAKTPGSNWFDRLCIEYERRDMYKVNPDVVRYINAMYEDEEMDILKKRLEKEIYASGWIHDLNKEPYKNMFRDAEAIGINVHPKLEETEFYRRATDVEYRKSIEEEFYKRKQACYELVMESHEKFPELFREPDGLFCGDNIVKFLDENNL